MKKGVISLLCIVLIFNLLFLPTALADSPVTSTPFSNAYLDIEMVEKARLTEGVVNKKICQFLASPGYSLDVKAAVINSIYNHSNMWSVRNNAEIYTKYIYQTSPGELDLSSLPASELLVIGYLVLLDDYFQPENALPFLGLAKDIAPNNFTIGIIQAFAKAQKTRFSTRLGISMDVDKRGSRHSSVEGRPLQGRSPFYYSGLFVPLS